MDAPRRFLFLADSGPRIGGGHVMRSLTLAETLAAMGAACAFVAPPAVQAIVDGFGSGKVAALAAPDASIGTASAVADAIAADWVFVDHYRLTRDDETALRALGRRIAVLDDLADRPRDCDFLLDPSYGRQPQTYAPLTPPGAVILTGPGYALVRPDFAKARAGALPRRGGAPVRRLLVSLGLTDVDGITGQAVDAILPVLGEVALDVVLGPNAPSLERLRALAAADPRVTLHVEAREMAALMAQADLAVGAGGSSTWERCCLGLPALTLVLADNQRPLALAFARDGIGPMLEAGDLAVLPGKLQALMADGGARARYSAAGAALCDGMGAVRAAEKLLGA